MSRADSESYRNWYKKWYAENRERLIQASKERRLADPQAIKNYNKSYYEKHKEKLQEYRRTYKKQYYEQNREHILKRDAESKKKREAKKEKSPKSPDARKLPRDYKPTSEPQPFGMPIAYHQRQKLLEICSQGFLEEEPKENPFHMTFL